MQTTFLTEQSVPTYATGDLTTENVKVDLNKCNIAAGDSIYFTVTFENNTPFLVSENQKIALGDVIQVAKPSNFAVDLEPKN